MALVSNSPVLPKRKKSFAKSWTIVERLGIKSNGIDKTEKKNPNLNKSNTNILGLSVNLSKY